MTLPEVHPNSHGWFEPTVAAVLEDWPRALPHFYAVSVAPDPGVEVREAFATREGEVVLRRGLVRGRHRVETIGYWRGMFGLVDLTRMGSKESALKLARGYFGRFPVRFLMYSGHVVEENKRVRVTGDWPTRWRFDSIQVVWSFCAYLFEMAKGSGAGALAVAFQNSIHVATPGTEQVLVFLHSLETARETLLPYLNEAAEEALTHAIATLRGLV